MTILKAMSTGAKGLAGAATGIVLVGVFFVDNPLRFFAVAVLALLVAFACRTAWTLWRDRGNAKSEQIDPSRS